MTKCVPISKPRKAGFASVEDLTRTAVGFNSNAHKTLPPQPRLSTTSSNEQRVRVFVPHEHGLHSTTQFLIQEYLNLVDWKGLELPSTERRC